MSWENILKQNQKIDFFTSGIALQDLGEKYDEFTKCDVRWELEIMLGGSNQGAKEYFELLYRIKELTILTDKIKTESGGKEIIDSDKITIDTTLVDFTQPVSPIYVELYNGMFTVVFS